MTPLQFRLHEERKARLSRMKTSQESTPIVKVEIPTVEKLPDPVAKLEVTNRLPEVDTYSDKPLKFDGWFWPEVPVDPEKLKVHFILKTVCTHYEIPRRRVLSGDRHANVVRARMLVSYLARQLTYASFIKISDILNKDHTSIIYAYYKLAETADRDVEIMEITQLVKRKWHEDSQDQCEGRGNGRTEYDGLQRSQPRYEQDTAALGGP